ncbi:PH domain-containing protein [Candidatus Saccharibacteria bacterium]|nr:PH domain-containing protein [Candidatus Saccharibacteria bacterium]MDQ5958835.1 hypothetical protein [Patescibacteria group bacterium]
MLFRDSFRESLYSKSVGEFEADEKVLFVLKQHPFGIILIYIISIAAFIIALSMTSYLLPSLFTSASEVYVLWFVIALVAALILFVVLILSSFVYNQSRFTLTNKKIVQITQKSIYERKISHLSLANIEDVTSNQRGILANMFNFGTIKVETAGEQANFIFVLCPDPHRVARIILESKDNFWKMGGRSGGAAQHNTLPKKDA